MHICFLSTYFPQPCGIASYTHYLSEALSASGEIRITIVAEQFLPQQSHPNFNVRGTFDRDGIYQDQVLERVKLISPDIIHIQHEYGIFGYDRRFADLLKRLKKTGIKVVVTLHTVHSRLSFHTGCTRPHLRRLLRKTDIENYQLEIGQWADTIIVHQHTIRNVLIRQGISPDRVVTLAHGTRILKALNKATAKTNLGIAASTPLILSFGYFEVSKNMHLLIHAFSRVKKKIPGAKLWLNGYMRFPAPATLKYRNRCLKLIEDYKLTGDVIFKNEMLPEDELPSLIAAADVACFAYKEDTYSASGALHLAMGLGKAVVASRISKFEELGNVSDEILVNPSSIRELSQLLTRLLLDKPFREYVEQMVSSYAQETSWSYVAKKHKIIYKKLKLQINFPSGMLTEAY